MRGMDRILDLQAIDTALDRLTARRAELEAGEEVATARAAMEDAEGRLGEIRLALDSVVREQTRLEHEIETMNEKAAAEERRMYDGSVANAKELEAMQHEVANIKQRRSRAEDEVLEHMERREELEGRAAAAELEARALREGLESLGGESVLELERIEVELRERSAERERLVPGLDEELLELYEDLRRQKRGVGAAALVDGVCQACHEQLSAMELDRLKRADGIKRCEHCRRIVVFA